MSMLNTVRFLASVVLLFCVASAGAQQIPPTTVDAVLNYDVLRAGSQAAIAVQINIPDGYHIQSDKPLASNLIALNVLFKPAAGVAASGIHYPAPEVKTYPQLGKLSIYSGSVVVYMPLSVDADAAPQDIILGGTVRYQMCDDKACYPPQKVSFSIPTRIVAADATVTAQHSDIFAAMPLVMPIQSSNDPGQGGGAMVINDAATSVNSVWIAFGFAFLAGIIFNAMPCVLPVLPLKAMSFYEVSQHHRGRTILLALAFSLGIISVFLILALLIFVFKSLSWGEQFSNPWFAWGLVALLGIMGLGMFGAFTVALPQGVYRFSPRHDTYSGNFLFGGLAAILSTPCTAPLFPLVIAWAVLQSQWIAVLSMIMVGVGMASPYIILSAFPELARKFPRVGPWAELVKQMMGFLLIGSAVFFASGRLMSFDAMWWPLVPVAAIAAVYLTARTVQLTTNALPVAVSSILAVGMFGSTLWLAVSMSGWPGGSAQGTAAISWQTYTPERLESALADRQPVLVDFTANWCLNCKAVEATVFRNETVIQQLQQRGVLTLRADLTDDSAVGWPLLKTLNRSGGIPLTAVYIPDQDNPVRLESIYTASSLLGVLNSLPSASPVAAIP